VAYGTNVTVVMNGSPVSGTIALGLVQGPVANPFATIKEQGLENVPAKACVQ
jgi:hypothetical protein